MTSSRQAQATRVPFIRPAPLPTDTPVPNFTRTQRRMLRNGLAVMRDPDTRQGYFNLVNANPSGEVTGHCAAGCLCAGNPDATRLVFFSLDDLGTFTGPGYVDVGQPNAMARPSSLPPIFAQTLGLGEHVTVYASRLSERSLQHVRAFLPRFGPGQTTTVTTLNDQAGLTLPVIADILEENWGLKRRRIRRIRKVAP